MSTVLYKKIEVTMNKGEQLRTVHKNAARTSQPVRVVNSVASSIIRTPRVSRRRNG